jgi:hypothetical protein
MSVLGMGGGFMVLGSAYFCSFYGSFQSFLWQSSTVLALEVVSFSMQVVVTLAVLLDPAGFGQPT